MSKYCIHCGHKQESSVAKFCSSCGEPLSSAAKKCAKKPSSKANIIGEDETDATEVPQIENFSVSVELPSNVVQISNRQGQLVFESSEFKKRTLNLDD